MQNELFPVIVSFSERFRKNIKHLAKKYRSIRDDLDPLIAALEQRERPGDRIEQVNNLYIFKVRLKNSDNNKGQGGGYRVVYYIRNPDEVNYHVILLTIYSKTEQADISPNEIASIISELPTPPDNNNVS